MTTFPVATYHTKDLAWTFLFTFAAILFPSLLAHTPNNQLITGTIVNAILFLAVWRVGIANTVLVAILPSLIAFFRGLLPPPMAILIPYIILSNVILISAFYALKKHPFISIVSASFLKFLFLFAVASYFIRIATPFLSMMQFPQLFTALTGGLVAIGIITYKKPLQSFKI